MSQFVKKILMLVSSVFLFIAICILAVLWAFSNNLPDYRFLKNYKPPVSSKVYSGEGELVSDFSSEKRIFVPYEAIPKKIIHSFLSAEDKNFFTHPGVDAKGVLRAVINNIYNLIYLVGTFCEASKLRPHFSIHDSKSFPQVFQHSTFFSSELHMASQFSETILTTSQISRQVDEFAATKRYVNRDRILILWWLEKDVLKKISIFETSHVFGVVL